MTNARYQRGLNSFSLLGRAAILVGGIAVGTGGLQGCAVTEGDVHRWSTTERGPEKLAAVVRHTKYRPELRVSAAGFVAAFMGSAAPVVIRIQHRVDAPTDCRKRC